MKLADYLDPEKFPLTSQPGLSASQQLRLDSLNLDDMKQYQQELRATGKSMPADDRTLLDELLLKQPHIERLSREAAATAAAATEASQDQSAEASPSSPSSTGEMLFDESAE